MPWIDLEDEIASTFDRLVVPFDTRSPATWTAIHSGEPKDVGIRVRRIGRDPERVIAHREATKVSMRRLRRRRRRQAYFRDRWIALKSAPLIAVEENGVIWMRPSPGLERHRERAREYQRRTRKERKAA